MSMPDAKQFRFTGYHMIGVMVLFFGTIITVNMIMAYHATQSWSGLVVKNSYVASQHFNEVTDEKLAHAAMGWKLDIETTTSTIALTLTDRDNMPIADAIVTAKLGQPVNEAQDRLVQFKADSAARYSAETQMTPGQWQADFTVISASGEKWTKSYRFLVKD